MRLTPVALVLSLFGCQTTLDPNYALQLESYRLTISSQQNVEIAKARAEEARYNAMASIAERSDAQTKSMAILALALVRGGDGAARPIEVALPRIPETSEDRALKWAAIFAGPTTAIATSYFGFKLGQEQSRNQAQTTQASYAALLGMKPAVGPPTSSVITNTNTWTTTNTDATIGNHDGLVVVGGAMPTFGQQDNSPVTIVPPVVPIVPVVVTNP